MFIIYIVVRTQLNPDDAPLPEPEPGDPSGGEKWALFGAFMSIIVAGFSFALFVRVVFFTVTGQNAFVEGVDAIAYGTPDYISWFAALTAIPIGLIFIVFGTERAMKRLAPEAESATVVCATSELVEPPNSLISG